MIAAALSNMLMFRATTPGPAEDFWYNPVGSISSAGIAVNPDKALAVSTVFACVRLLGEALGSLPWRVHKRDESDPRKKALAPEHDLWNTLHNKPNRWQTPMEWREMGVAHICLRGNFYNRIVRNEQNEIELVPLSPDRMQLELLPNRHVRYHYQPPTGPKEVYSNREIFHVRGLSLDGLKGLSVLEYARNAVGSAMAQETHGAALFKNGGLPTFWISRPPERKFTPEARSNFRAGWRKLHGGAENSGSPPILEDGMAIHEMSLTNRDSQWIEARGFQGLEICRFFRVDPHLVGIQTTAPLGTVEQQSIEFVVYTLSPWAVRLEQAANRDLLEEGDSGKYYTKIAMDALLRGDLLSRYQAHNVAIQGGWELVNEARELEDRNPIEGGDTPRYPLNMQPAGGGPDQTEQGGQPGKGKPKPAQQKPDDEPTAYEQRRQKKKTAQAAFAVLLDEAAARIAAAEIHGLSARADKAAEDYGKFRKWAIGLYAKHAIYAAKTLDPICAAWRAATECHVDPDKTAARLCSAVWMVSDGTVSVPAILETWKTTRAGKLAQTLKEAFFDETL